MRRAMMLAMLVAGCGAAVPPPEAPGWRDRTVPIGASLRGGPADLVGEWVVSAGFPVPAGADLVAPAPGDRVRIGAGVLEIAGAAGGRRWSWTPESPGVYRAGETRLWLLWVDDDFRTAVIGAGDGRVGWVMDRPGQASADRARAAREILDFNGYDLSGLVP